MKLFVETHEYNPVSYKIDKPLKTAAFENIVDAKTYELCKSIF